MTPRNRFRALALCLAVLQFDFSHAQESCRARVEISVNADIPNARDPSFITGLLANPLYRLTWVSGDDSPFVYDLTGPASDAGCANMIEQIGRDAAVQDVRVLEP